MEEKHGFATGCSLVFAMRRHKSLAHAIHWMWEDVRAASVRLWRTDSRGGYPTRFAFFGRNKVGKPRTFGAQSEAARLLRLCARGRPVF